MDSQRHGNDYKSQVMAATNIVDLIGRTVSLKKAGKNYIGLCPFHSEKSPSFSVNSVDQFFYCYGCKKGGDAIAFVMERDRVGFREALKQLGDSAGIEEPEYSGASKEKAGQRKQLLDANSAAGMFFEKLLADPVIGKAGRDYLLERGFNAESVKNFHIGLSVDAWDGLLKSPLLKAYPPAVLATAGLVKTRESGTGFYDTFRNRLMFPIRDENGRVIAFGGRAMPGSEDKAKYLNSPETPLFSKSRCLFGLDLARQRIVETRQVAVVEGYTDVVMCHQFGATNVVSPLGTALTEGHVHILRRFADKIVLLFDADTAGDLAVNRAVELFLTQPVEIFIAAMPDGVDPDEFLLANGLPAFENVLKNAADALTYTWNQLDRKFKATESNVTGQQQAVQQYMDLLAKARETRPVDDARWAAALRRVERLTGILFEDLNKQFAKKKKPVMRPAASDNSVRSGNTIDDYAGIHGDAGSQPISAARPYAQGPRRVGPLNAQERSERWILAILLNEPHRWAEIQHDVMVQQFTDESRKKLAELYWQHQRDEGEVVFAEFLGSLTDPELIELAVSLFEESAMLSEVDARLKEAVDFLAEHRRRQNDSAKHLAELRRISRPDIDVSGDETVEPEVKVDPNDVLRKLQENARRPDLRRI